MAVDLRWFKERVLELKTSQRQVALQLPMDPGQFSRLLHGERKLQAEDVVALSRVLGVCRVEIRIRFGDLTEREVLAYASRKRRG